MKPPLTRSMAFEERVHAGFICLGQTRGGKGLFEVTPDILEVLNAKTDTEQVGCSINEPPSAYAFLAGGEQEKEKGEKKKVKRGKGGTQVVQRWKCREIGRHTSNTTLYLLFVGHLLVRCDPRVNNEGLAIAHIG